MQNSFAPFLKMSFALGEEMAGTVIGQTVDPLADMVFNDGRRFRVLTEEVCIREGDEIRFRFGHNVRFAIDFEVQSETDARWNESGHPQGFCVLVTFDAIQSGALESLGYGTPYFRDRETALLLLSRLYVHRYLARSGGGGGYSTHTRPTLLWVDSEHEEKL